jgi:hypothetical protein
MTEAAPRAGDPSVVVRDEVPILFLRVADDVDAIGCGWTELEGRLGPLRGRRFYGAVDEGSGEYRVCVARREGDDPAALGLEQGTLPGGRYVRVRLRGEPPAVYELIGPTFRELAGRDDVDRTRPEIEFYRRLDEIDLLVPVA